MIYLNDITKWSAALKILWGGLSASDLLWCAVGTGKVFPSISFLSSYPFSVCGTSSPKSISSQGLPMLLVWSGHGWYWNQLFIDFKDRWSGRASFHDARAPGGWLPLCWVSTYPLWVCFLSYLSEALLPCGHSLGSIRAATGYPSNDNSRYHHLVPTFCFRSHSRLRRGLSHHHWVMGLGASPVPRTSH